jgi:hypothetical protein
MLKKAVRLGILVMLVLTFTLIPINSKPAHAIAPVWEVSAEIFNQQWDGTTDYMTIFDKWSPVDWWDDNLPPDMSISDFKAMIENEVGHPVTVLAVLTSTYCGPEDAYVVPTNGSDVIGDYQTCEGEPWSYFLIFNASHKGTENIRLTLFGYVNDDNKSCVLWSLDGSRPVNVDNKCGGGSELVCTVKLVEKKLKYNCDGGYDWLGEQIVRDPQWLAWADKFASMNGNK